MSTDNGPEFGTDSPVAGISPPKSNKKLWIFGGLGCLGLIGLVCVGAFFLMYSAAAPTIEFINDNVAFIGSSPEVADVLGAPITVGPPQPSQDPGNPGALIFRGTVSGTNGDGTYVVEALMEGVTPVRQEIYLEANGEKIDLDPEAMFELQIDDGG